MANIPVEKNRPGWLPWLLALAAIVLIGWIVVGIVDDDDDVAVVDTADPVVTVGEPEIVGIEPLTTLTSAMLITADNPDQYVGREVTLTNLRVEAVPGDKAFIVSPPGGEGRMLVILDQQMTPGVAGIEGRYDVNPGQMVQVAGIVREVTDSDLSEWMLGDADIEAGDIYVYANALDLSGAELDQVEVDNRTSEP